jgi:glycosyltransferase involved in cell wall biosynthesis
MNRPAVSAIIPAYNEAATVGAVVRAAVQADFFDSVIVVDDGSVDDTASVSRAAGARVIALATNQGKGAALAAGVAATASPLVCFLDADLIGLRADHLERLLSPVHSGEAAMAVGMWDRGRLTNRVARLLPRVSGQRCLRRDLFAAVPSAHRQGYRIETALNWACRANGWRSITIDLPGLRVKQKPGKIGLPKALISYTRMHAQVLAAMVAVRWAGRRPFLVPER